MADDEPVFTSLKDRIAALNLQQAGAPAPMRAPKAPPPKPKLAPRPPVRDPSPASAVSTASTASTSYKPPTPARPAPPPVKPPLPSKATSLVPSQPAPGHNASHASARSPPLPTQRPLPSLYARGESAEPPLRGRRPSGEPASVESRSSPVIPGGRPDDSNGHGGSRAAAEPKLRPPLPGGKPQLPPRLPSRGQNNHDDHAASTTSPPIPSKPLAAPRRTLPPSVPRGPSPPPAPAFRPGDGPPPIPLQSRPPPVPLASRPTSNPAAPAPLAAPESIDMPPIICLVCRDYTHPDAVAAQYPRHSLPRDPIPYLADVLCSPFEYLTDKARAIFTWLHHNVEYDVKNFLAGTIPRGHTAEDTIHTGKGVCDGFGNVFLAIAQAAGLECLKVSGHGKGFGYKAPAAGSIPPFNSNHAWNAVRLDDGQWKLLDSCWGAGNLTNGAWDQKFKPEQFTKSNDAFGESHFPEDEAHQFRGDGRVMSWEEYIDDNGGDTPTIYGNAYEEGLDPTGLEPAMRFLDPAALSQAGLVRFQIPWVCDHWAETVVANKGGPLLLMVNTNDDVFPMEYNGEWWYVDIQANKIRGNTSIVALDKLSGKDARGVTKNEFLRRKGWTSYSYVGIAQYEVV
ncbi:hypothetical protein CC85DRAFT_300420 [Cutaneotrichosporon oleaginosum]|uniref:Transglutaminase-like domain-containing protein n=1 Tax=Cutaneotrichosporon oleaginosum TaxID=879819 RepID=A0A0J0XU12_9TREE|nr:uncharacterized protein CC85DRAFT_300420 [Cutaneotrichosporon oleaginosum]KLT44581.1 hypothetical protein CC85DRAFT_300420 [Cutaneotrichosporon oleaginosum]TXT13905.1 hypothetical protein COLE_00098 [Cutaneotrichosporon oleaginosum]